MGEMSVPGIVEAQNANSWRPGARICELCLPILAYPFPLRQGA